MYIILIRCTCITYSITILCIRMNYTTNIRGFLSFSVFCRCSRRRERQSFACAGMADDGGEGGGDSEGKELGEQQLVAVTAAVVVPIVVSQKKLLVLDVNGLLVATYYKQETLPPEPYHVKLGNFYVYKRPFCEEFIRFCLENFTVGIWSSAQAFNVNNLVEFVFKDLRHQLAFSWVTSLLLNHGELNCFLSNNAILDSYLPSFIFSLPPLVLFYSAVERYVGIRCM
jgi:hypothetical protein